MTAFAAVLFFVVVRAVIAGYGGAWFFPAVLGEALNASIPFLTIAIAEWALARYGRAPISRSSGLITVIEYVALFAYFAKGWVEPHTHLSEALGIDSRLSLPLAAAGLLFGLAIVETGRRLRRSGPGVLVWATAGFLIVGPQLYWGVDAIEAGERLRAAVSIVALFTVLAAVLGLFLRVGGVRAFRSGQWAAVAACLVAAVLLPGPPVTAPGRSAGRASIVVVMVDTLRADMVDEPFGAGYLMPRLKELAARGIRFTEAVAPSPWTLPSSLSLLTGLNPHRHGTGRLSNYVPLPGDPRRTAFPGPALRRAGYQVAGFFNNPYLRPYYGIGRGYLDFRRYRGNAGDGVGLARSWIARHHVRPFVLYLHLMDPHWPYQAPHGYGPERRDCATCDNLVEVQYRSAPEPVRRELRRRYMSEVAFTDASIGRLYDAIEREGLSDRVWLIVTADHGEEFWEHGHFLHGHSLFDELLRVPLVVVPPRGDERFARGRTISRQVRLEDVGATVFDLAGLPLPPSGRELADCRGQAEADKETCAALHGRLSAAHRAGLPAVIDGESLLSLLAGAPDAVMVARPEVAGFIQADGDRSWAVRTNNAKLIVRPGKPWPQVVYDLRRDRGEKKPVVGPRAGALARALRRVPAMLALDVEAGAHGSAKAPALDSDLARELRSLGYLD